MCASRRAGRLLEWRAAAERGGAHTDHEAAARFLDEALDRQLVSLAHESVRELLDARYEKFRKMGQFFDLGN